MPGPKALHQGMWHGSLEFDLSTIKLPKPVEVDERSAPEDLYLSDQLMPICKSGVIKNSYSLVASIEYADTYCFDQPSHAIDMMILPYVDEATFGFIAPPG